MNDAPQIDDRRRFKELWKELVFARFCAAVVAALPWAYLAPFPFFRDSWLRHVVAVVYSLAALALPSWASKRGKVVVPLVAGAAFGAALIPYYVVPLLDTRPGVDDGYALVFTICAAMGLAEGLLERSVATTWCGLVGGALSGWLAGALLESFAPVLVSWPWDYTVMMGATLGALHLGIGLSLALGRYIRDLPKRKAQVDPAGGEG